jgi:hypothetical protein
MLTMPGQDWYAVLQLRADATTQEITAAVERRSRQAASLANTAPERSQQLREQVRAIKRDLLSGTEARERYDAGRVTAASTTGETAEAPAQEQAAEPAWPGQGGAVQEQTWGQQEAGPYAAAPRRSRFRQFMQSGWTCWHCGESSMPGDRFCTQCCAQLTQDASWTPVAVPVTSPNMCPYCGTTAASTHRFCRACGAARPA